MSSRILCCASERSINIRNPTKLGRKGLKGHIRETLQRFWRYQWRADWVGVEHRPRIHNVAALRKINDLLSDLGETPETFTRRILFMSMFNDISCDRKGTKEECLANAKVVSRLAKKFGIGQWSFIGPGSEEKLSSVKEDNPQGIWDHVAEKMLLEFAENGCPIFRATTPVSRCKLKRTRKTVDTFCCTSRNDWDNVSHSCVCQSAQSLRSSRKHVWRIRIPFMIDQGNLM